MRRAVFDDVAALVSLMGEFYAEGGYKLDHAMATKAFAAILADERLGYVWMIHDGQGTKAGYAVLTLRFGMEYGGLIACIDDLFVLPQSRNLGLSTAALSEIRDICKSMGIRAITVEVGYGNKPAQAVYRRIGLVEAPGRQLLALALAPPTHVL